MSSFVSGITSPCSFNTSLKEVTKRGSEVASYAAKKINKYAVPLVAVAALACIPVASALGPDAYKSCMQGCASLPPGIFQVGCWAACLAALA